MFFRLHNMHWVTSAPSHDAVHIRRRSRSSPVFLVLAAGFPCQPFSSMGKKEGDNCPLYGDLRRYIVEIAAAKRPVAVLLENVAFFFHPDKPWYRDLDDAFKKAGYVCCYNILSAGEFGLPQHRKRGFSVAVREDVPGLPFKFPPVPGGKRVTIRELLLAVDFPDLKYFKKLKEEEVRIKWTRTKSPGAAWEDIVDNVPSRWRTHSGILNLGELQDSRTGAGHGKIYHDLGHHPCITTSDNWRGWFLTPGADEGGLVARKLHLRELCRIQGFPDSFELQNTSNVANIRQLGNSVPPAMVEWIGRAVAEQFRGAFVDQNDNDGDDEDDENRKETKKAKTGKSKRKSHRRSRHKSQQPSKRHSKRHSKRRSKHRSKHRSRLNSAEKSKDKSSERSKSTSESSSKRRLSSDSDTAPPPKRQDRKHATSPDEEAEFSVRMPGFDGDVEGWVNRTTT